MEAAGNGRRITAGGFTSVTSGKMASMRPASPAPARRARVGFADE